MRNGNLANKYGYLGDDTIYRSSTYCTTDINGKTLYFLYGVGIDIDGEGISPTSDYQKFYMVVILNSDGSYDINTSYMELKDLRHYQKDLIKFKELNNWQEF